VARIKNEVTMPRILPLRLGWEPAPGADDDYPDGLPEEWRLTYFANMARGVVLAAATWRAADRERLAQWRDDVHPAFRFYLTVDDDGEAHAAAIHASETLGERLGGWIAAAGVRGPALGRVPCHRLVATPDDAAHAAAAALAWAVPPLLLRDLRAASRAAERMAATAGERPLVAILGCARFADLQQWNALLDLLGLS
jgi:hypothetical protein